MHELINLLVQWYYPALLVLAFYFIVLASMNVVDMRNHTAAPKCTGGPMVSVLIPMRNEEGNITNCIGSLINQDYENYEILVIDDNSTDGTPALLKRMAREHRRLRIFSGAPLPEDWYGKPFALQQLAAKARGEIIMFTDADTVHRPTSISWTVTNMYNSDSDFISGYIGQKFGSLGELITVPLMYFLTGFLIPLFMNRHVEHGFFSSAVGQYIAVKRSVFERIGGFSEIRKKTSEDMYLARYVKKQGYKTMFLDAGDQVQCRMYKGYRAAVEGIGKNIFDVLGKNTFLLCLIFAAVLFFLLLPFPLLLYAAYTANVHGGVLFLVNILYTATWAILFLDRRIPWYCAFLWPLIFLNLLYIAWWSWFRTISGQGFVWKDRVVA
ncbi:MAG: glycosyltransferase [Treponema sp.]|jgi:chlorobactene glucosyltransferase|nr:glycosyltransferase [Treponema sp.]